MINYLFKPAPISLVLNPPRLSAQAAFIVALYGTNVAWTYEGDDAYLSGTIKLSHGKLWLLLGAGLELVRAPLVSLSLSLAAAASLSR